MAAPASASAKAIEAGHEVGPYVLTREIGKGSFAVVFQGKIHAPLEKRDTKNASDDEGSKDGFNDGPLDGSASTSKAAERRPHRRSSSAAVTRVAIKVVTRKKLTAKLLENLEGEISILRTIRHANIVELLDCLKTSSHIYLVMQFCRMGDLSVFIRTRRRPNERERDASASASAARGGAGSSGRQKDSFEDEMDRLYPHPHDGGLHDELVRSFLAQLASALGFMRSKNIVHRDIKPQNLLLQEPEPETIQSGHPAMIPQLKVADFGFARHLEAASLAETLCGSPLYMAPEILRYEKYDAKADLWSVGAVLFEMSIGKPPFRASNHVELLRKIERGEDKIKFPDERSDDSLRREHARKASEGKETSVEVVRPHTVDDDIKTLIRQLLRRRPIERMSFEDFFLSDVLQTYAQKTAARSRRPSAVSEDLNSSLKSPSPSPVSSGFIPVAKRVAPAVPSNANPLHRASSKSSARANALPGDQQPQASPASESNADGSTSHAPPIVRHYFAPKYVVGGQRASQTSTPEPKPIANKGASMLHAAVNARISSKDSNEGEASSLEDNVLETPGSSMTHLPSSAAQTNAVQKPVATPDGKSTTGTYDDDRGYVMVEKRNLDANAMAAEDAYNKSKLRTAVGGWSPLGVVRRPSQLGRLASLGGVVNPLSLAGAQPSSLPQSPSNQPVSSPQGLASTSSTPTAIPASKQSSQPTSFAKSSSPNYPRLGSTPPNAPFAVPPGARRPSFTRRPSNSGDMAPRSLTSRSSSSPLVPLSNAVTNAVTSSYGSTGPGRPSSTSTTYSLSPADAINSASPSTNATKALASSTTPPKLTTTLENQPTTVTSSALSRAVSMASIRLFGVPTNMSMRGAGVRRSLRMGLGPGPLLSSSPGQVHASTAMDNVPLGSTDVAEQNLLSLLHEYGQKSFVLSEFADARLGAHYAEGPHQNNYLDQRRVSQSSMSSMISGSDLVRRSSLKSAKAHAAASPGTSAAPSSDATVPPASPLPSEVAASEAYVLYVRSLSFLQRGMDAARDFMEARASSSSLGLSSRYAPSSNINSNGSQDVLEAMQWLRAKFADGVERAKFARSKSVEDMPESAQNVDKMIFEEALEVARRAAVDELENNRIDDHSWNGERCLLAYETACTMLQSLLDPPTESAAFKDLSLSAIGTIEKFIASISKRMSSIQRKYELVHPSNVATSITT